MLIHNEPMEPLRIQWERGLLWGVGDGIRELGASVRGIGGSDF